MSKFIPFPKMARLSREVIITEKIDGSNGLIAIGESGEFEVGSRNRWITPNDDNYGFARWAHDNKAELMKLGPGRHFGEWWGQGIGRKYGLAQKRFSLFNVDRWDGTEECPACCHVVPVLGIGMLDEPPRPGTDKSISAYYIDYLKTHGSAAAPGFMNPEGIVIYHTAASVCFKKTILRDDKPKSV